MPSFIYCWLSFYFQSLLCLFLFVFFLPLLFIYGSTQHKACTKHVLNISNFFPHPLSLIFLELVSEQDVQRVELQDMLRKLSSSGVGATDGSFSMQLASNRALESGRSQIPLWGSWLFVYHAGFFFPLMLYSVCHVLQFQFDFFIAHWGEMPRATSLSSLTFSPDQPNGIPTNRTNLSLVKYT